MTHRPFAPIRTNALLLVARTGLTIVVVWYVVNQVDWETLCGALRQVSALKLTAAICLQGLAIAVGGMRWRMLLVNQDIRLSWLRATQLSLVGLFFNLFFLGSLAGDVAKFTGVVAQTPKRKARLVLSLIQDRLIGLGGLLLLLTGLMLSYRHLLWDDVATRSLTFVILGGGAAFLGATAFLLTLRDRNSREGRELPWRWRSLSLKRLGESFPKPVFLPALCLSLALHVIVIIAGYTAAKAVNLDLSLCAAGVVLGLTALALSLPLTLAGLGVREGMLIWLLGVFGYVEMEPAIGLSACLLGINLFWAFAGGLTFSWYGRRPAKSQLVLM